jgi:hypothetical protein
VIHPVLSGIFSEREILQAIVGDIFIKVQENAKTSLCDKRIGGYDRNMVAGYRVPSFGEASRRKELFH